MRVLLTGCAGFIASEVAAQLLERGDEVVGLDNLNEAYDPRLKAWRLARLEGRKGFAFHRGDVARAEDLAPLFTAGRLDAVLNLAARAGVRQSLDDPWAYLHTNAVGMLNLLDLARRHGVPRVLLASTSSLYAAHNPRPFREDADTDRPLSPYAASKKAAESMGASYAHLYGLDVTVVRYFTVYGPAGRPDMSVFRFVRNIAEGDPITVYGDGSQERDFTYVEDIARGTLAALRSKGFEVINLGSDRPVRLDTMMGHVERLVGRRAVVDRKPMHPADVKATWADIGKARSLLGWSPQVPLERGLERTVEWYLKNREWARDIALGA